jgi:hypothetical protein
MHDKFILTDSGRRIGGILYAMLKVNQPMNVDELASLCNESRDVVLLAMMYLQFDGSVMQTDAGTWGIPPEFRSEVLEFLNRNGWSL